MITSSNVPAICRSVEKRCQMCINTEGKQFEHLFLLVLNTDSFSTVSI
jgi:hypothetical protein